MQQYKHKHTISELIRLNIVCWELGDSLCVNLKNTTSLSLSVRFQYDKIDIALQRLISAGPWE